MTITSIIIISIIRMVPVVTIVVIVAVNKSVRTVGVVIYRLDITCNTRKLS